jgi:hypothetical protein
MHSSCHLCAPMISFDWACVLFFCQAILCPATSLPRYFTVTFSKLLPCTHAGGIRSFSPVDWILWHDAQKARSQVDGFVVSSEGCGYARVSDGLATEREEVVRDLHGYRGGEYCIRPSIGDCSDLVFPVMFELHVLSAFLALSCVPHSLLSSSLFLAPQGLSWNHSGDSAVLHDWTCRAALSRVLYSGLKVASSMLLRPKMLRPPVCESMVLLFC